MTEPTRLTVEQGGRRKAYRPLSAAERNAALAAGIAAYNRGDFFEAHELLEPAWMGSNDPLERDFHQGLIKLAAAFVHAVRGNPLGVEKNLRGARDRLAAVVAGSLAGRGPDRPVQEVDVEWLVEAIDERLAALRRDPGLGLRPLPLRRPS